MDILSFQALYESSTRVNAGKAIERFDDQCLAANVGFSGNQKAYKDRIKERRKLLNVGTRRDRVDDQQEVLARFGKGF